MDEKYEFFAPIWRVMRDDNMTVEEVKNQIEYVARVTIQASQISDLRGHTFCSPQLMAPVVYFRGHTPGVCTYFDDRKGPSVQYPHGACWYERCLDLRVIDVPGDHFSLLRQDVEDMNLLITGLKTVLGPFGWSETIKREDKPQYAISADEIRDIDSYLRKMGVNDPGLRRRLEASMPYATEDGIGEAFASIGQETITALNAAAKSWLSQTSAVEAEAILILCCDANGRLGGMEGLFGSIDLPCYAVCLPQDTNLWESPDIHELATVASKAIQRSIPLTRPVVLGGVGFGGVLAHELALQLDAVNENIASLALFEGFHTVSNPEASLSWLAEDVRRDTCQAAVALYPLIVDNTGTNAPSIDAIVARLASIDGFDEQLDYIASFKPKDVVESEWDRKVDLTLSRLGYYKTITENYSPKDIFPGQSLVFAANDCIKSEDMTHDEMAAILLGPNDSWKPIRFLVQPVSLHLLDAKGSVGASVISRCILESIWRREDAENRATGVSALPLMSPRPQARSPYTDTPIDDGYDAQSTVCVVTPLNRLCPERRYILRHIGRSGTPAQLSRKPLSRIPVWIIHSERGDISTAQKELAALLQVPCYGIALGPDAEECEGIEELASAYCSTITEMQPSGPYLLLGSSIIGSKIAHAMAIHMQKSGRQSGLIVLDGCVGTPSVPLHDATWYALFYLLREIGSLSSSIGEFVDFVQGAGSPTQQLKFITSFKPADPSIPVEAWEAAVYATLDRAAALKRMASISSTPMDTYDGPSSVILPKDRLGRELRRASDPYLSESASVLDVSIEARHTECLLSRSSRQEVAEAVTKSLRFLLRLTG